MQRVDGGTPEKAGTGAARPLLAASARPTLSWAPGSGSVTVVVTAADDDPRDPATTTIAKIDTDASSIRLPADLAPFRRYRWALRGAHGWSPAQTFECGPLQESDWTASWVHTDGPATAIALDHRVAPGTAGVRLHIAAQGLCSLLLDDRPLTPSSLEPVRADPSRAWYRTYDLDRWITPGAHRLTIRLGSGDWAHTGLPPRVRAEIVADGPAPGPLRLAGTSAAAPPVPSPLQVDEPFFRELIDLTGHTHAPTQRTVTELAAGSPLLPPQTTPDLSPSVREVRRVPATETTAASPARVFDVGENIAGRSRITIRSSAPLPGRTIRVVHAEHLRDGRADTTNLALPADVGRQRQTTEYRCGDDTISVLEPMFAIHGFRFVDIVGLDDDDDVTVEALVIHSDLASAGHIETDDPVIERLMTVADRTARNTMHGIPEDCPTREQAGWTGDAAAVADFTFASYDLDTFAAAWITDILDSQRADGSIPAVAPDVRADGFDTDPVWGSALVRMVSRHLAWTGRSDVARDALPGLRRWLDFLDGLRDDDGLVSLAPVSYGHDWLGLEQTPPVLLHTASVIEQAETLATLEESVGDAAAAADRRALAAALRSAFRAAYVRRDAEGLRVGPSSQGALAAALAAGALGQEEQSEAVDLIVADIVRRGHRVSTGYAATRWLLDALGEARRHDLVRAVLDQPDEPGVGAMLRSPHGTFWECWWVDRENTGTGSLDHIGLGGVFAAWTWRWLVGLRPASPGARHLRLRPDLPTQTRTVRARRLLPAGPLEVHLRREDDVVAVEVELPRGATVALEHPDGTVEALPPGRHRRVLRQRHTSEDDADAEPATPWAWTGYPDARTSPDERDAHIVALDRHGDPALDVVGPLRCMPVPHAQPATDWCRLPAGAAGAPRVLTLPVRHEFEHETGFAFAWIDICDMAYSRELRASIEVIGERGTRRSAERRLWPAGANRVACALDGWPREEIIEHISVTVQPTPDDAGRSSAPIHVGRVGFSARSRSW